MGFVPGYAAIGAEDAPHTAFVLHGILASGKNWRSFARRVVAARPEWRLLLVDLRNHGVSRGAPRPHTVVACGDDLERLATEVGGVDAVIGHSFGGKVAFEFARRGAVRQVWSLDSPAGATDIGEAERVIQALRSVPMPAPERTTVVDTLRAEGFPEGVAQWMSTNVERGDSGWTWRFDLEPVIELLHDYRGRDYSDLVASPPGGLDVHVVRGGRSDRWSTGDLEALGRSKAHVHVLEDAGHWVHVDAGARLLELVTQHL